MPRFITCALIVKESILVLILLHSTTNKVNRAHAAYNSLHPNHNTLALPSTHHYNKRPGRNKKPNNNHLLVLSASQTVHDDETKASLNISDVEKGNVAYPFQTPHSGRHFLPSHPFYHTKKVDTPLKSIRSKRLKLLTVMKRIVGLTNFLPKLRKPASQTVRNERFMEGWYHRLTLPEENISFAFIFSIDDPRILPTNFCKSAENQDNTSQLSLVAAQVMGPNDEYIIQSDRDHTKFWAWEHSQGFGCTFEWNVTEDEREVEAMSPLFWRRKVASGFQILPNSIQGRIDGVDGTAGGEGWNLPPDAEKRSCSFDINIEPISGWGDSSAKSPQSIQEQQKSTAGWLASFPVFEPHWQVTISDAKATGTITWRNKTYEFTNAPYYAEKNWGGSFPTKWYWMQCNTFESYDERRLSLTAGGGIRQIPMGKTEELGMICVHYDGVFYEAVPWTGTMNWDVSPWGRWILRGRCTSGENLFEIEVLAHCDQEVTPGVMIRAPTIKNGLSYFCRDTFMAEITLSLWSLKYDAQTKDYIRHGPPIIDSAQSSQGAGEVGGVPWSEDWIGVSDMKQPMKGLVRLPYTISGIKKRIQNIVRRTGK